MSNFISIINYGMGNLYSVKNAFDYLNISTKITDKKNEIINSCGIVLPGVGAFKDAIKELKKRNLFDVILKEVEKGKPLLGICLGMQLLFTKSYEFGNHFGFNFIKGKVVKFKRVSKVPHIGWNSIKIIKKNKILSKIKDNSYFYFVHSYYCEPEDKNLILTTTKYENIEFVSGVVNKNIFGFQFHPEKSGKDGLQLYKNFYKICINNN